MCACMMWEEKLCCTSVGTRRIHRVFYNIIHIVLLRSVGGARYASGVGWPWDPGWGGDYAVVRININRRESWVVLQVVLHVL
jgi:hypothetical protein